MHIQVNDVEEASRKDFLKHRTDPEAPRLRRLLALPDLSRTEGSPLKEIVGRTLKVKSLSDFDTIEIPEIVRTDILFDLFNMPEGHPARSKSDTYYVDDDHVLRTHDTVFWYYYLNHPDIKERITRRESFGTICHGKVYRKDEIDARHMNVFHQMGGLYLAPDSQNVTPEDLKNTLSEIARAIFGDKVEFRFYDHNFPYTDPSFEMEAFINGHWIEMLGSGMPRKTVLKQLKLGQKYKEVSKFPPVMRDISFIVPDTFIPNDYFDLIREVGGEMVEDVEQIDKYENAEKFGVGKLSYTFRITYRHLEKTLTNEEVNAVHAKLEERTERDFGGQRALSRCASAPACTSARPAPTASTTSSRRSSTTPATRPWAALPTTSRSRSCPQ
ncbi:hypothetical protein KW784_02205 [Candidatus Parcubacteria bacterium]|nr:hypothetical protein [Candidatus Parcubacteria bacterium]